MSDLLQFFVLLPLFGFLLSLVLPRKKENIISGIAIAVVAANLIGLTVFTANWLWVGMPVLDIKQVVLYQDAGFEFYIDFYFDPLTAVFAWVGAVLILIVFIFSRYYMHRERGFKRFFNTLMFFCLGYNLLVFAGNFETFFIGWEILGITSFLLIAFYRDRYLPVKNGFKVLSFYRLGDICMVLAMWMSHHFWHKNIAFAEMGQALHPEAFEAHSGQVLFISLMILIAAAIKSAQFPFSTWLPRAMEGPTSSSAIFYGALSVHIGAFLLLRTHPFWSGEVLVVGAVFTVGLVTSLLASSVASVQSSVKTQIAYASIVQIGLIFIEIALGFHGLAMLHFAGNAFLRTYQLLVSPSVLSYRIHDMFFHFKPRKVTAGSSFLERLQRAVYILSIKEWNLDHLLSSYLWQPFKWLGEKVSLVGKSWAPPVWALLVLAGSTGFWVKEALHVQWSVVLPMVFSLVSLLVLLEAFAYRKDARTAWLLTLLSQFFTALAIVWNKDFGWHQTGIYLSGTVLSALVGYVCLHKIQRLEGNINLDQYHGHSYEHLGLGLVFLLSCLGFAGFPITPTFLGIDLMFTHISASQIVLVALTGLNFLFLELTLIRIYTRIFLGQHQKAYHPIAFRSS